MTDPMEEESVSGTNDIYGLAGKEERLASLVDRLERRPN